MLKPNEQRFNEQKTIISHFQYVYNDQQSLYIFFYNAIAAIRVYKILLINTVCKLESYKLHMYVMCYKYIPLAK